MRTWLGVALVGGALGLSSAWAKGPSNVGGGHMQHCPTAVAGAKTVVADTPTGVEITVTSQNPAKVAEIRDRAKHLAESAKAEPTSVLHNGAGHGGGGLGLCEVVLKDTTVTSEEVEGGAKISVKPNKPVDLEWLKKETRARQVANGHGKRRAAKSASAK